MSMKRSMRTISTIGLSLLLAIASGYGGACSNEITPKTFTKTAPEATSTATPETTTSTVRSVDFANFTYHGEYISPSEPKSFTLSEGKAVVGETQIRLAYLDYGDVTGNGNEEAIVVLAPLLTGSATPLVTYIFALKNGNPEPLFAFSAGDGTSGGLRRAYAENGRLIVERFSRNNSKGDCCPTQYKRSVYSWDGIRFKQRGATETLPNPSGNGDAVMPEYKGGEKR